MVQGVLLLLLVFSLSPTSVSAEDNWLLDQKTDFEQFLANLKSKEVLAQGVLDQARRAEAKAIQLEDHEALPIARQAVDLAQQGVAEAQRRVARQQVKVAAIEKTLRLPRVKGAAVDVRGQVLKKRGNQWVPMTSATPLGPGDTIRTGSNGTADVLFEDYSRVMLGPNSVLIFERDEKEQSTFYRLKEGLMHFLRSRTSSDDAILGGILGRRYRVHTATVAVAVRGTEFDLRVDDNGLTHLVPYSGTVEMTALPEAMAKVKIDRWWEKGKAVASKPLLEGKLLRVASTQGEVKIEGADGTAHAAVVVELLAGGEKIVTGKEGFARIELADGAQGTLAANTSLSIMPQGTPEAVRYEIQQGRMHAIGSKETGARLIEISTPNAMLKGQWVEFDILVNNQGLADVVPLSGTVEVTAQRDKRDSEKIRSWWEEP